ncbi:undecaprenyl-diphosphate phosphatase [Candidatus Desantisbacteria bacterium]|nr:undecaprenyl-diphosphate phosphatase [Candidatus Desantisbacteria bacterium]
MNFFQSIILGLAQGLTEFLPVSSSAHLVFIQTFFGLNPSEMISFDVFLHFGTLLAVVVVLREYLMRITKAIFSFGNSNRTQEQLEERRTYIKLFWMLIIGTLPAGIIGVVFKSKFEEIFSSTYAVAVFLIITGFILWITKYFYNGDRKENNLNLKQTLLIGFAQAFAIFPGISRSGSTITAGLVQKLDKKFSAEFSFLLSIPVILGATVLEVKHIINLNAPQLLLIKFLTGTIAAFLSGWIAIKFLIKFIERNKLYLFSYYCWFIGILVIILKHSGI